jgi:hypothetical protein
MIDGSRSSRLSIYAWCVGWYVHENSVLVVTLRLAASSQWVFSVIYLNIKFNFKYKLMVIFECNVNNI